MVGARTRLLAGSIPYLAVLAGLHGLGNLWVTMGLYHLGMLAVLWGTRRDPILSLLRGWQPRWGWSLAALGAMGGLSLLVLYEAAAREPLALAGHLRDLGAPRSTWLLLFAYYVGVTPFLEEAFWRGRLAGPSRGLEPGDVLFAGYHVLVLALFLKPLWTGVAFVSILAAAWLWRQAAQRARGLLVPLISHVAADISIILAAFHLASRESP